MSYVFLITKLLREDRKIQKNNSETMDDIIQIIAERKTYEITKHKEYENIGN